MSLGKISLDLPPAATPRTAPPSQPGAAEEFAELLAGLTGPPQLTESGAPLIALRQQPAPNGWNYKGPAAYNPYYTTTENPLREGYVAGYDKWFDPVTVTGNLGLPSGRMSPSLAASEEGAEEALRLIRHYVPEATLEAETHNDGYYSWDKPVRSVVLPNGTRMNAGLILEGYYNKGYGVSGASDDTLALYISHILG